MWEIQTRKSHQWYEHYPEGAAETDEVKIFWEVNIQCDHLVEAKRPDMILINKHERNALSLALLYQVTVE